MTPLFDPGLQPERTELAWRRTALALGVGSLIAIRLLPAEFGDVWWAAAGVAGVVASALLWHLARRRYRSFTAALRDGEVVPGAGLLFALAGFVVIIGLLGGAVLFFAAR